MARRFKSERVTGYGPPDEPVEQADAPEGFEIHEDTVEVEECPDCRGTGTAERKLGKPDEPCPSCGWFVEHADGSRSLISAGRPPSDDELREEGSDGEEEGQA